ncbi:MAG: hypothetical protein RL518_419 [Pseudomonadota bacterium]
MVLSRKVGATRRPYFFGIMMRSLVAPLLFLVALEMTFVAHNAVAQSGSTARRLGTNLESVTDYSPQVPFTDLFLSSREWFTQCQVGVDPGCTNSNAWDTGEAGTLDLDANGWVRSLPASSDAPIYTSVATFWDLPSDFPAGRYVVLYEGQGTIEYGLGATKIVELSSPGRDVVQVNISGGGILLRIATTDTLSDGDYVRSIRFVAQDDEGRLLTNRFSARFIDRLRPYTALRFMDWMRTNDSIVSSWNARAKPTDARYATSNGVPVEVMVELSNTTEKAPWFTMPHQATDEYVQQFATIVRDQLLPSLPIYVEYSNEIWNSAFSQGDWVEDRGVAEWPGSIESRFTKRINWHGKRTAQVCDIWRSVFGASPERVICVLASQAANSWTAQEGLSCPLWNGAPCASHGITAIAIAPYFGGYLGEGANASEVSSWTSSSTGMTKLFTELKSGGKLPGGPTGGAVAQSLEWIEANKSVANLFNVALLSYEGGQHLVGVAAAANNSTLTTMFTSANRDVRMGELYTAYLEGWEARGGGLFMHFNDIGSYSRYGSWGALEDVEQVSSPKYDALWTYSLGTSPPGSLTPTPVPTTTPSPRSKRRLRVRKEGRGEVVSSPAGIRCGGRCTADFATGKVVRLIARPSRGYRFAYWTGACSSSDSRCSVALSSSKTVGARFVRAIRVRKGS